MKWFLAVALFVFGGLTCEAQATFPTEGETQLLLTQADRAMAQYKGQVDEEEHLFGKRGAEAAVKDRQEMDSVNVAVEVLRARPDGFNSLAGFKLFEFLTSAGSNALLCVQAAEGQASELVLLGNAKETEPFMRLSQSCLDTYALIYTVTENAASLYERYIQAEQALADKGYRVAKTCSEALKKLNAK